MAGSRWLLLLLVAVLTLALLPPFAFGAATAVPKSDANQATLTVLEGAVLVVPHASGAERAATSGETLQAGDRVRTETPGRALLTFFDGSEQELDAGTEVLVQSLGQSAGGGTLTAIAQAGGVTINRVAQLGNQSSYQLQTPSATALVRGTVFRSRVLRDPASRALVEEDVASEQGDVEVRVRTQTFLLHTGQRLRVFPTVGLFGSGAGSGPGGAATLLEAGGILSAQESGVNNGTLSEPAAASAQQQAAKPQKSEKKQGSGGGGGGGGGGPTATPTIASGSTPTPLPTVPVGSSCPGTSPPTGGSPQALTYGVRDDTQSGGPNFNWVEISGSGTAVNLSNVDDACAGPLGLPFNFPFYGETFDQVYIDSNGLLSFVQGTSSYTNVGIPSTSSPNLYIAPFWDDIDSRCRTDDGLFYQAFGSGSGATVVFEWLNWDHFACSGTGVARYTFEVIIHADGRIFFQYLSMDNTFTSATIGIENQDGTLGTAYSGSPGSGRAVELSAGAFLAAVVTASPSASPSLETSTPTPTLKDKVKQKAKSKLKKKRQQQAELATATPTPTAALSAERARLAPWSNPPW